MANVAEGSRMVELQLEVTRAAHLTLVAIRPKNLNDTRAVMFRQRFPAIADRVDQ